MIVVVGSRHDRGAVSIVEAVPSAVLCTAEDLTRPGWVWGLTSPEAARWVVDGSVVDDREVTGVFVRRNCVYPEELLGTHPDDREYLAAESTAFLIFVLSRTAARVVNPVSHGALGEGVIRPERWMPLAEALGLDLAPLRLRPAAAAARQPVAASAVEVVGSDVFGEAPSNSRAAARQLAVAMGLLYAVFVFDEQHRLVGVSAGQPPSGVALSALASLLNSKGAA